MRSSLNRLNAKLTVYILVVGLYTDISAAAGIDQSVWQIATVWTVLDSKHSGMSFLYIFWPDPIPTQPTVKWVPGVVTVSTAAGARR
jgi:hypothetical protein